MVTGYVRRVYNVLVRPHTPRKLAVFNGIAVRGVRLFDATDTFPNYERPLIAGIRSRVTPDDTVTVVGGGRGVSSVSAAHRTGPKGSVNTYEGSAERCELATETVDLNGVDDIVEVNHNIVGEAVSLANASKGATTLPPGELPACDVLVLDCEGAEIGILEQLDQRPRVLIVETHAFLDSPEEDVRATLDELGYEVVDRGVEVEEMGVYVLTAVERR